MSRVIILIFPPCSAAYLVAGTVSSFGIVVRSVVVQVVPQAVVVTEVVPFPPVVVSCSTVVAQADTENLRTDVVVA